MNSSANEFLKDPIGRFTAITSLFTGLKAKLFAYSSGFRDLYISLERNGRYFLFKFTGLTYAKSCREWLFKGFDIKRESGRYKVLDQEFFEVLCDNFLVVEIVNGQDVVGAEACVTKTKSTNKFSLTNDGIAHVFRYDRWDKILLLKVVTHSGERSFLACYGCQFLEFGQAFPLKEVEVLQDSEFLIISEASHQFSARCISVEVWSEDEFESYDIDLFRSLGEEKRYGVRKTIFSVEEL
ncbi:MAG: hypothetical protein EDM05_65165 [Leptolyngbya sp. IPPAS B-1204]|nr:MAG: hypothetical protein EDM05_34850 [Leptolyngbya sp. IPPAS B-1204]